MGISWESWRSTMAMTASAWFMTSHQPEALLSIIPVTQWNRYNSSSLMILDQIQEYVRSVKSVFMISVYHPSCLQYMSTWFYLGISQHLDLFRAVSLVQAFKAKQKVKIGMSQTYWHPKNGSKWWPISKHVFWLKNSCYFICGELWLVH